MAQNELASGFVKLCIDTGLNFYDGKCRVLISGQGLTNGGGCTLVPDVITRVDNDRDIECMFGRGSVLTEALRVMFCECGDNIQIFALPRADPAGGVAAVYTTTITGPATSDGRFTLFMGNDSYNIDILVEEADTVAAIAAKIVAAVPLDFPYICAATGTGVTWTARNKGLVGNYLSPIYNWAGRKNYAPGGVGVTTVATTPGTGSPPEIDWIPLAGECCYSCIGYLGPDEPNQTSMRNYIRDAWDCSKPQCFGHGYVYNSGSLGGVLARGDNSAELNRVAYALDSAEFPYLMLAAYIAQSCCETCDNPETAVQGPEYGVLDCIRIPQTCSANWTYDERIQLQDAGFVTYGPAGSGEGALTNLVIYNDITNNLYDELGRSNPTYRDTNSRRLAARTAVEIATKLNTFNGLALFTKNTKVKQGIRGTNPRLVNASMRAWAKERIGVLFSEFDDIDKDIIVRTDFETAERCRGIPGKLGMFFRYRPPIRITGVEVDMQPKLLDNCDR